MDYINIAGLRAGAFERVDGRAQQTIRDEAIKAAYCDPKSQTARAKLADDLAGL
jgi:hypothetical protein